MSRSTIARWEGEGLKSARRSNLVSVFKALDGYAPLRQDEAQEFMQLTGLTSISTATRRAMQLEEYGRPRSAGIGTNGLSAEEALCYSWLAELLNNLGAQRVLASLKTTAAIAGIDAPDEPDLDRNQIALRVAHPPVRLPDGAIEQRFTYYNDQGRELVPIPPRHQGRRAQ